MFQLNFEGLSSEGRLGEGGRCSCMQGLSFKSAVNTALDTSQGSHLELDFSHFIVHVDKVSIITPALQGWP